MIYRARISAVDETEHIADDRYDRHRDYVFECAAAVKHYRHEERCPDDPDHNTF